MKQFHIQIILCSFLLVCCTSAPANAQSEDPVFVVTPKNQDDQIDIRYQAGTAFLDIQSPSGIGSAEFTLESGTMPGMMIVRLHLMGLEEFRLASVGQTLSASVSSNNAGGIHQAILTPGSELSLAPGHPLWMKIDLVSEQQAKRIPLENGYFEITLPSDFLQKAGNSFEIHWIDFYR